VLEPEPDADALRVIPPERISPKAQINCGQAGTLMRFLPPVAALAAGVTGFVGDAAASGRPMAPLLQALEALGVGVSTPRQLPFRVCGRERIDGGTLQLDSSASSQFVSGLLLAAPRFARGLEVVHTGRTLPSRPHVSMTLAMLRRCGVRAQQTGPNSWRVWPGRVGPLEVRIEPDLTNTATFLAAALVTRGTLRAPWPVESSQPHQELLDALRAFGATVGFDDASGERLVVVDGCRGIRGANVDLTAIGEFTPAATALAAQADSPSRIKGISHVKGHESNRIAELTHMLTTLGVGVDQASDGLIVMPKRLRPGLVSSAGDHRMAHAAALLGLNNPGVLLEDVAATEKTLPDFPALWRRMAQGA
jgi:3-phosphoshikimate 1-carboxyvinyltransferase